MPVEEHGSSHRMPRVKREEGNNLVRGMVVRVLSTLHTNTASFTPCSVTRQCATLHD